MIAKKCYTTAFAPMPFIVLFALLSIFYHLFIFILILFILIQIFFVYFFRDMPRKIEDGIISPADGVVVEKDGKISIFMSVFDMHVNLSPYDGVVKSMKYTKGLHKPAYGDVSKNERMEIVMETDIGEIVVVQIAGIFARRIVPYVNEGDRVKKGDKIGVIKFGSRVEVILPENAKIVVDRGRKIKAGETIALV
ncbi:MAG: phosphatidylserine decarboxylase [Thermoplasmata archaeon]|nr:phosphatidylserine decarboxylase [Thermoplasmata archaeon]